MKTFKQFMTEAQGSLDLTGGSGRAPDSQQQHRDYKDDQLRKHQDWAKDKATKNLQAVKKDHPEGSKVSFKGHRAKDIAHMKSAEDKSLSGTVVGHRTRPGVIGAQAHIKLDKPFRGKTHLHVDHDYLKKT